jgi:pimeloyl-ACP methyl ester carboxylesterase
MVIGATAPDRVAGVFFFACNMDPSGVKPFQITPVLERCIGRHKADYAALSAMPGRFDKLQTDLTMMQRTQPNFSAEDLGKIQVPVTVAQSEFDEFIRTEHAEYLAQAIPKARYVFLKGLSHFAPLQRPQQFNAAIMDFLNSSTNSTVDFAENASTTAS